MSRTQLAWVLGSSTTEGAATGDDEALRASTVQSGVWSGTPLRGFNQTVSELQERAWADYLNTVVGPALAAVTEDSALVRKTPPICAVGPSRILLLSPLF